jgi:hypothetical protein
MRYKKPTFMHLQFKIVRGGCEKFRVTLTKIK